MPVETEFYTIDLLHMANKVSSYYKGIFLLLNQEKM